MRGVQLKWDEEKPQEKYDGSAWSCYPVVRCGDCGTELKDDGECPFKWNICSDCGRCQGDAGNCPYCLDTDMAAVDWSAKSVSQGIFNNIRENMKILLHFKMVTVLWHQRADSQIRILKLAFSNSDSPSLFFGFWDTLSWVEGSGTTKAVSMI